MKRLAFVALMLAAACEKTPSKLDGMRAPTGGGAGAAVAGGASSRQVEELESQVRALSDRIAALEKSHSPGAHSAGGAGEPSIVERTHKLESAFTKYGEALDFLNQVYAQQKAQQEMQEAQELDPAGVYAVDVSAAVKAGQVEGPNSATVTVVEAWDFA